MIALEDIKNDMELVNDIDWDMTPEEAVTLYLEWGNNWSHGKMIRSKEDVSHYFVLNTWEDEPRIYLIRRNSEEAVELACIPIPTGLADSFLESVGHHKGVYGLSREVREWLEGEVNSGF
ncbi:MAG: hypothetical protein JRH09_18865 [Deltaproteobacteria bacterium]|nr:hypothetical protein [Deltaproteobacteria bacterium]